VFIQDGTRKSSPPSVLHCKSLWYIGYTSTWLVVRSCVLMQEATAFNIFYDGISVQHLATPQNFLHHSFRVHLPMKMEQTQCSETSAIKHHKPDNNPKGYTRHNKYCYILFRFIIDFTSKTIVKGTKVTVILLLQKRKVKSMYVVHAKDNMI
jgi:hypothetical protein